MTADGSTDAGLLPVQPAQDPAPPKPRALDQAMADLATVPVRVWQRAAVVVAVGTVLLVAAPAGMLAVWHATSGHDPGRWAKWWIGLAGEAGILLLSLGAARGIRAQAGSWQAALGLVRPTWRDLRSGLLWTLVEAVARGFVVAVFEAVLGRDAVHNASNLHVVGHVTWWRVVLALLVGSLLAPVTEEIQCRGVLLRAGMARWNFRRAAVLSSVFFGLLHADQASSVAGAVVLSANIAVFGYLQCVLVRRSGRLAPAMVAHGANNAIALWVALAA